MTTSKFWAYTTSEKIDLMKQIALFSELVGAEVPTEKTNGMIVDRIVSKFPQESFTELNEAITMVCTNELKDEDGKRIEHFGKMSLGYIGLVMAAYKAWKQSQKAAPPRPADTSRQIGEASDILLLKAEYIAMLKWIKDDGGIIPSQGNFYKCFNYLVKSGRLTNIDYTETIHECAHLVNIEADKLQSEQQRKDYRKSFAKGSEAFKNMCREFYFKKWLKEQFTANADENNSHLKWIEDEIKAVESKLIAA